MAEERSNKGFAMTSFRPVTAALRVLDVLLAVNRLKEASVGDIYSETGLNRPTIVRMLETLMHAGFVARHPAEPIYMPTGRTLDLSSGYQRHEEMALAAGPVLERLHKKLQWPSDVAVFDQDAMVVARTSRGAGFLHFNRRPGYRAPLLGTSLGMSFLAFCDEKTRANAIAALAASNDPWNAIVREPKKLQAMLNAVRKRGYATMNKDYSDSSYGGMASSVGVPVLLGDAAVGSLNLMYLRNSIDEAHVIARFVQPLQQAAADVAQALNAMRVSRSGRLRRQPLRSKS
jgi:IclR family transcriptional regulator, mhp operon transcriptional activator